LIAAAAPQAASAIVGQVPPAAPEGHRPEPSLSRQEQVSILNDALAAFDRGTAASRQSPEEAAADFAEAADGFQRLVNAGVRNGRLYYNLGNSRLRGGQIGRAIAAYRRAERWIPDDARLKENLHYARSLRREDIAERGERAVLRTVFFWHYDTPLRLRFMVGLAAYVLFWACLTGRALWPRTVWRYPLVVSLVFWLTLGTSVAVESVDSARHREGVVVADEVVVRKGNGEGFEPQFEQSLGEGVEFELLEQRGDWLRIRLPDGQEGWIRSREAELI